MTKLFAYFALFCIIGSAFADVDDPCPDNDLFGILGITKSESGEVAGANLKYCKSLIAGTSCCASSEIDKFQAKIEAAVEDLEDAVILRDKAISTLRTTTVPALLEKLATLKTNAALAATRITADIDALPDNREEDATPLTPAQAEEVVTSLTALATITQADLTELKTDFTAYQAARGTCIVQLLNIQAAAYCLACDPAATLTKGLGAAGAISLSADVCTRLRGSCFDYVTESASQSAVLAVGTITEVIDDLNTALAALGDDEDDTGYQKLANAVADNAENEPADATLTANAEQPSVVPEACTASDCDFICEGLFVEGEISGLSLVLGGTQVDTLAFTPAILAPGRLLQGAGSWDPSDDEAGVTIEWKNDPADVNSDDDIITLAGASIIKSGFVCVIALLSLFFL